MKIWIGDNKHLIKQCIDYLIKNHGAIDKYEILHKCRNSDSYCSHVKYLYLTKDNWIGSGEDREYFHVIDGKEIPLEDILQPAKPAQKKVEAKSIANTKIWIGENKDLSREIQTKLFQLGCSWRLGKQIYEVVFKYLLIDENKTIFFGNNEIIFKNREETEITYEELIKMCSTKSVDVMINGQKIVRGVLNVEKAKEESFIIPQHLLKTKPVSNKQIPTWEGKLYIIPPKDKIRPRIKAKRAWEIL